MATKLTLNKTAFEAMWETFDEEMRIEFANGVAQQMARTYVKKFYEQKYFEQYLQDLARELENAVLREFGKLISHWPPRDGSIRFEPNSEFNQSLTQCVIMFLNQQKN